jgi:hypothetical protein
MHPAMQTADPIDDDEVVPQPLTAIGRAARLPGWDAWHSPHSKEHADEHVGLIDLAGSEKATSDKEQT